MAPSPLILVTAAPSRTLPTILPFPEAFFLKNRCHRHISLLLHRLATPLLVVQRPVVFGAEDFVGVLDLFKFTPTILLFAGYPLLIVYLCVVTTRQLEILLLDLLLGAALFYLEDLVVVFERVDCYLAAGHVGDIAPNNLQTLLPAYDFRTISNSSLHHFIYVRYKLICNFLKIFYFKNDIDFLINEFKLNSQYIN